MVLCDSSHDVRTAIEASVGGGAPALVPVIATFLVGGAVVLPIAAFTVAGAVAAIVMVRGIKGFCREYGRSLSDKGEHKE